MSKQPTIKGFKNEVVRTKRQVPAVLKDYPERRFWRLVDAPLFSKSYLKIYVGYIAVMAGSFVIGLEAIKRFDLFQSKIFRGTFELESDVRGEFEDIDESLLFTANTFTDKFRQREKERLEQLRKAKEKRKLESRTNSNQSTAGRTADQTTSTAAQSANDQASKQPVKK